MLLLSLREIIFLSNHISLIERFLILLFLPMFLSNHISLIERIGIFYHIIVVLIYHSRVYNSREIIFLSNHNANSLIERNTKI